MENAELKLTTDDKSASFCLAADLVGVWKQLNHVYDGAPLGGVGFEQCQSFIASGRRNELQDDKDMTESGDAWITQAGLENVAQADTLVTVDHGVDNVLPSVLHGLMEERRVVLVEDDRCSPSEQKLDGGHVALTSSEVECSVLDYQYEKSR